MAMAKDENASVPRSTLLESEVRVGCCIGEGKQSPSDRATRNRDPLGFSHPILIARGPFVRE